jgi:ribosomal protein S6--L-glutamate ligase
MAQPRHVIALGARLRGCRNVTILGVRPNPGDYPADVLAAIHAADRVYYPGAFYAELFQALGKATFPSRQTYACAQDKIKQSALFSLAGIPHPRTGVFYGRRQKGRILEHFDLPLVAKVPRGSAMGRGVALVRDREQLARAVAGPAPAYVQEYLPGGSDIRVVVIGRRAVHAYWRLAPPGDFRCNLAQGGRIGWEPVPEEAIALALRTAGVCGWDDVGIDILPSRGAYWVLEGNMRYGREGFRRAGIDYRQLMERLIADEEI